jgi:hypothetical protein
LHAADFHQSSRSSRSARCLGRSVTTMRRPPNQSSPHLGGYATSRTGNSACTSSYP